MKRALRNWLSAGLNKVRKYKSASLSKTIIAESRIHGFSIYWFKQDEIGLALQKTNVKSWLSLIWLEDEPGNASFFISKAGETVPSEIFRNALTCEAILFEPIFFNQPQTAFTECAMLNLYSQKLHPLNSFQKVELDWIKGKIESTASCDYIFKNEYLQQLLLQVIHFAVKNFSACKSSSNASNKYISFFQGNPVFTLLNYLPKNIE
jgi:hypothetical protein